MPSSPSIVCPERVQDLRGDSAEPRRACQPPPSAQGAKVADGREYSAAGPCGLAVRRWGQGRRRHRLRFLSHLRNPVPCGVFVFRCAGPPCGGLWWPGRTGRARDAASPIRDRHLAKRRFSRLGPSRRRERLECGREVYGGRDGLGAPATRLRPSGTGIWRKDDSPDWVRHAGESDWSAGALPACPGPCGASMAGFSSPHRI